MANLSTWAKNSIKLYRGGNPSTIVELLESQHYSVVDELKQAGGTNDLNELALKLSLGLVA